MDWVQACQNFGHVTGHRANWQNENFSRPVMVTGGCQINQNCTVYLVEWWVNISKSGAWLWLCLVGVNNLATIWPTIQLISTIKQGLNNLDYNLTTIQLIIAIKQGLNNLDYNLTTIQLIIPNKQGLMCLTMSSSSMNWTWIYHIQATLSAGWVKHLLVGK
jgi:hypothetical protein